jgi:crotonobetainyl-CoA:carnitine CoA-transferase CaiB-like acyl-CoA transferase
MTTSALDVLSVAGPVDLPLVGEADVQAACGLMHVHGRRFGTPTLLGLDYASIAAAELAETGLLAAELARARGIPIRGVATSVAQAALLAVCQYLAAATADDDWPEPLLPGGPPFVSADGVAFEIEAFDAPVWQRFWAALHADQYAVASGWRPFVLRYATASCALPPQLADLLASTPFGVVEDVARRNGMSLMRVSDRMIDDLPPYVVGALPGRARENRSRPVVVLPLSGMVVLESCRRVLGPMAGHLLGLLGATVVRVEPPGGDPLRGVPPMSGDCSARFRALNRGKEVVEIDLNTSAGRRDVLELARGADVFLHNWGPGKAEERGLRAEDLAWVQPGIVYAHASGWGDRLGPRPPMGTDFMVQAHAGVAPSLMTIVDVFGGLVCAHGVVDALLRRERTEQGQCVDSSLLSGASRLNARSRERCSIPLTVPVCTDLAALAADPRFAPVLIRDGCAFPLSPWEFTT